MDLVRPYDSVKRWIDVVVAGVALFVLSPVIAVTAACVRWKLGAPVLFAQTRPGRHGLPFQCYKFRSMTDTRGVDGALLPDEVRLTRFGKFLRATSADELPQLFNVLKGDMSLVGPRPLLMDYLPLYSAEQARRHDVRPGVTGYAQVNGRNAISWDDRLALDVSYVENRSFALDCKIILKSVAIVVGRRGIAQAGSATMPRFEGSKSVADKGES
jgi:lipopolysaccharide/colanic/teichoic acid biosynthesis glycosyltransferase